MNQVVKDMLRVINLTDKTIHNDIALNAIHYTMGLVASATNSKFMMYDNEVPINYFGLTLAGSGEGKDRSVDLSKNILAPVIDIYHTVLQDEFAKFNSKLGAKDKPLPLPMFEFERATVEGFLAPRVDIQTVGFGCTNLRIPEIQDMLQSKDSLEIFSEVVKAWEVGDTGGKTNRGHPIPPTTGIPVNVLVYGSPNAIKTNKGLSEQLLKMLTSGLGRRAFLAVPPKHEVQNLLKCLKMPTAASRQGERDDYKEATKIINDIQSHVLAIVKKKIPTFRMTDSADQLYAEYNYRCKTKFVDAKGISDGLVAEMLGRAWKAIRLAAMYAFFGGYDEIKMENMEDAIEYTERCGKNVEDLYHVPSNQELLLSYLSIQTEPVTRQAIMKDALDTGVVSMFKDSIALAEELADERNQVIEMTEDKIPRFSLTQLSKIDLDHITISTSGHMGEGWKARTGKFDDLAGLVSSPTWYSAGTFKDGLRLNANYEQKQDIIVFDIDEDMELETAKAFFSDFKCIIATTRSHQKEKHKGTGDIWDRFRIILIPDSRIELDPETYSKFMLNAMDMMGLPADRKAIDPARFFFGYKDSKVWISPGDKLFPVKACLPSTTKAELVHKRLEKYDDVEGIERYFISSTDKGDRNNKLWDYACVLKKNDGYDDDTVEKMVIDLNSRIADPLSERELKNTILKSIRKK